MLKVWMTVAEICEYASIGETRLRQALNHPTDPLPSARWGNKRLINRFDFDAYMRRHQAPTDAQIDDMIANLINEVMK